MEVKVDVPSRKRRRRAKDARARPPKPASPDDPRDTVYTSRLSFDPRDIAARERVLPAQEVATDWYDAFQGRVAVDPLDAGLNPDSMFCAGSMQHAPGAMFGNWRVENGVAVCDGPGPLGPRFDRYAADMEPARLARLVADITDGIDVRRDFEEGYLARNDTDAVRFALPTVPNAGIVHDYPVVMDDYIRSGLISGKIICYGLLADLAGVGGMVMTQGLTIEPNKPRVCWRGFDHNRASLPREQRFEGLGYVRENIRGGPAQHDNIDEKSGYDNNGLHASCLKVFAFAYSGFLFAYTAPPFGCQFAGDYQQDNAMVLMGFFRWLGGLGSLYVDDHHISTGLEWATLSRGAPAPGAVVPWGEPGDWHPRMFADLKYRGRQWCWCYRRLMAYFGGRWVSSTKSGGLDGVPVPHTCSRVLGLIADSVAQCFRVPDDKVADIAAITDELLAPLVADPVGQLDFHLLGRWTGKMMALVPVIPRMRLYLVAPYCVLADSPLHGHAHVPVGHAWYSKVHGRQYRIVRGELRVPLLAALRRLRRLLVTGRVWPFLSDQHRDLCDTAVAAATDAPVANIYSDATLVQGGAHLEFDGDPDLGLPCTTFGSTLPTVVAGVVIVDLNTGVTEVSMVYRLLGALVRVPKALAALRSSRNIVHCDNMEDVRGCTTYKLGGTQVLAKARIIEALFDLCDEHGIHITIRYINTKLNPADQPSRASSFKELRMSDNAFEAIWRWAGGFDIDLMGSDATAHRDPDSGDVVPYYSFGPELGNCGMDFFAQLIDLKPGSADRARGYLFPGADMLEAAVRYVLERRADVLLVVPLLAQPFVPWRAHLARHAFDRFRLAVGFAEGRRVVGTGWIAVDTAPHEVLDVRFHTPSSQ